MMVSLTTLPSGAVLWTAGCGVAAVAFVLLLRYRSAIRRRIEELNDSIFFGNNPPKDPFRMVRVKDPGCTAEISVPLKMRLVDLDPEFVESCSPEWKLMSLGDYFASLRPGVVSKGKRLPEWVESEIQAGLAAALMRALGPSFGTAVLPVIGTGAINKQVQRVAGGVASYLVSKTSSSSSGSTRHLKSAEDRSGIPLSLFAMTYVAELNYQIMKASADAAASTSPSDKPTETPKSPIQLLKQGEVGFKPCFNASGDRTTDTDEVATIENEGERSCVVLPNPFVLSEHWNEAIAAMERLLVQNATVCEWKSTPMEPPAESPESTRRASHVQATYDPNSKSMKPPVPVDARFLPGLHIGWGAASCTHTQREILKNRLLSVLLNRLASNYYYLDEKPFIVKIDRNSAHSISKPHEIIEPLVKMGHKVSASVRTHTTTFGVALCVKEEEEDTWTNIPLAFFLRNGYVNQDGTEAFVCLPHSGLDLDVRDGPLLQKGNIQHFMSIDGLCGWQSNHNADVPWIIDVQCGETLQNEKAAEGVQVAAMEAIVINGVATKFQLPLGGYGLTGVCNDSAALIECALFDGKTNIYPLTFNGRFAMQNLRLARELRSRLVRLSGMKDDVKALDRLIAAISSLPSDVNSLPFEAVDQCRRQLHCLGPRLTFALMRQSQKVVQSVLHELDE